MSAPFYNCVKGTSSGAAGTGAFTPLAASTGYQAWSTVPTGWIGLVRYDDGTAWELTYSYWNGTTLSRASTQVKESSTGSQLTLSASATASLIIPAADAQPQLGTQHWGCWKYTIGGTTATSIGTIAPTVTGTASAASLATTNYLTEQQRTISTSATTANAQAGFSTTTAHAVVNTTAGRGGFDLTWRWGCSGIPTGPRMFQGMTATTFVAVTTEPSALTANYAVFAKDSTDTNIQLLTNSNVSTGTKINTGIPLVANAWYESSIFIEPGSNTVNALLIRLDTGAIWFGKTSTDVPATGSLMFPQFLTGLSSTTGTAIVYNFGHMFIKMGQ
jgi:hypothetical protein